MNYNEKILSIATNQLLRVLKIAVNCLQEEVDRQKDILIQENTNGAILQKKGSEVKSVSVLAKLHEKDKKPIIEFLRSIDPNVLIHRLDSLSKSEVLILLAKFIENQQYKLMRESFKLSKLSLNRAQSSKQRSYQEKKMADQREADAHNLVIVLFSYGFIGCRELTSLLPIEEVRLPSISQFAEKRTLKPRISTRIRCNARKNVQPNLIKNLRINNRLEVESP